MMHDHKTDTRLWQTLFKAACGAGVSVATAALVSVNLIGCGRIVATKATDQLIAGDAVDRTVSQIDFRILTGKKVFLDTNYINKTIPGVGFVTSEYMISSVRQKMMCDGCLLQEKVEESDFVVEMRIGALGADGHEVIYGVPPNSYLNVAASVVTAPPAAAAAIPAMPELSFAKKDDTMAAAKIALFAYNRKTRDPIWQSGISESRSLVADRWFLGAGPFHKGNIYGSKKQAQMDASLFSSGDEEEPTKQEYFVERRFSDPTKSLAESAAVKPVVAAAAPAAATPAATTPATTVAAAAPAAAKPATAAAAAPAAATPAPATAAATTPVATTPAATTSAVATTPAPAATPAAAAVPATSANTPATVAAPAAAGTPTPPKTDRSLTTTPSASTPVSGPVIPVSSPAAQSPQAVSSAAP